MMTPSEQHAAIDEARQLLCTLANGPVGWLPQLCERAAKCLRHYPTEGEVRAMYEAKKAEEE